MTQDNIQQIIKKLDDHENRIRALENNGSSTKQDKTKKVWGKEDYSGATGGLRFIIKNGFFKIKRNQTVIRKELAEKNYYYSSQAIYEALKILAKPSGSLVALKEKGKKVYVERK